MKQTIKALIAVRSGSMRVKNKNIAPFAGSSLLAIKIKQLQQVPELSGVVVNSNDNNMLQLAKNLGAETVKRDEYYSTNSVSPNELYVNIAENFNADVMVFANATNPLVLPQTVTNCIKKYKEIKGEYDSVNTVNYIKEFLWLNGKAINYDPKNKPRSQDLPDIVSINHAVNVIGVNTMIKNKDIFGLKPYLYTIDKIESIDIDDIVDFEFAEFMYKKLRGNE